MCVCVSVCVCARARMFVMVCVLNASPPLSSSPLLSPLLPIPYLFPPLHTELLPSLVRPQGCPSSGGDSQLLPPGGDDPTVLPLCVHGSPQVSSAHRMEALCMHPPLPPSPPLSRHLSILHCHLQAYQSTSDGAWCSSLEPGFGSAAREGLEPV